MSPEEARALVEEHGSIRAAARAIGMSYAGFHRNLDPERARAQERERKRRYLDTNPLAYARKTLYDRRYAARRRGRKSIAESLFMNTPEAHLLTGG